MSRLYQDWSRLEVDEVGRNTGIPEPGENVWQVSRDWEVRECVVSGEPYDHGVIREIRQVAEESEIELHGRFFEALETLEIYYLAASVTIHSIPTCNFSPVDSAADFPISTIRTKSNSSRRVCLTKDGSH